VKNARAARPADAGAPPSLYMQRSQSRISLSASFEALAIYFPCVNSFDEDDGGEWPRTPCSLFALTFYLLILGLFDELLTRFYLFFIRTAKKV